ncbi:MAG: hypothetical protein NW215_08545 [Hyphomicrobiales bacterium]|nr:hypothetical protein [Hyphomicrobiales bacterium]
MIASFIGRVFSVIFGVIFGALTALVVLFWVGGPFWAQRVEREFAGEMSPDAFAEIYDQMSYALISAPAAVLAPCIVAVVIGEALNIRSVLYYVAAGGVTAAMAPLAVSGAKDQSGQYLAIVATAGFAAGFIYWLIAGRKA